MAEEKKGFGGFFSKNLDAISRLFIYHIAMCIFGLVVAIATVMLSTQFSGEKEELGAITYIASAFAVLVYLGLIYVCMWEKGAADKIKIDGGRLNKNNARGILFWLIANSVNIFMVLKQIGSI